MVKHFELILLIAGIVSSLLLITGLFKPYALLWWQEVQTRRMVIRLYGRIAIVCFTAYLLFKIL